MQWLRKLVKDTRGFTLIEAIVTVVIVGMVVVPLSMIYVGSLKDTIDAKKMLNATELGQLCIENMKMKSEEELMNFFGGATHKSIDADAGYFFGFPNIPKGYSVDLSYSKDFSYATPAMTEPGSDFELIFDTAESNVFKIKFNGTVYQSTNHDVAGSTRNIFIRYYGDTDVHVALYYNDQQSPYIFTDALGNILDFSTITSLYKGVKLRFEATDLPNKDTQIYIVNETNTTVDTYWYVSEGNTATFMVNNPANMDYFLGSHTAHQNMIASEVASDQKLYTIKAVVYDTTNVNGVLDTEEELATITGTKTDR